MGFDPSCWLVEEAVNYLILERGPDNILSGRTAVHRQK